MHFEWESGLPGFPEQADFNAFDGDAAPLRAAGIPLVMTPGNHDASAYAAYAVERAMYKRYHARHPPTLTARPGAPSATPATK